MGSFDKPFLGSVFADLTIDNDPSGRYELPLAKLNDCDRANAKVWVTKLVDDYFDKVLAENK